MSLYVKTCLGKEICKLSVKGLEKAKTKHPADRASRIAKPYPSLFAVLKTMDEFLNDSMISIWGM